MNDNRDINRHRPAIYRALASPEAREIIFVTVATKERKPILAHPGAHELFVNTWRTANAWLVGRYMILPDHLHFFCARGTNSHTFEEWMRFWKASVTRGWPEEEPKRIWQRAYWDTRLRRGEKYTAKWDYVRENPVRANLCVSAEAWPYQGELHFLPW